MASLTDNKDEINVILGGCDYTGNVVIKNLDLTNEEAKFISNPNSHADFLIYNKMSKKPVLVIEVDGVSFHEQNAAQLERDSKKNSILNKAGIKLIRLKTNGSNEEEAITKALLEATNK